VPETRVVEGSIVLDERVGESFKSSEQAGKCAPIKRRKRFGIWETFDECLKARFNRFGLAPFFVSEINSDPNTLTTRSVTFGECLRGK